MTNLDEKYPFDDLPARKRHDDGTTWGNFWQAIAILAGVLILVTIVANYIQVYVLGERIELYRTIMFGDAEEYGILIDGYKNPFGLVLYSVIPVAMFISILIFFYTIIHMFTTQVQRDNGSFRGLAVRANSATMSMFVIFVFVSAYVSYWNIVQVVEQFEGVSISESETTTNAYMELAQQHSEVMTALVFIVWLGWAIWMSFILRRNYSISAGKGFLTMILSSVLIIFIGFILITALGNIGINFIVL